MWSLRRNVHTSWHIAVASSGIFLGVFLSGQVNLGFFSGFAWLLTGVALILSACLWQRWFFLIVAILGGSIVGAWRGSAEQTALHAYQPFTGQQVEISGTVADDSDVDKSGKTVVRLKNIRIEGHPMPGLAWVGLSTKETIERSDVVTAHAKLTKGFGTFSVSSYSAIAEKISRPEPGDVALHIRDWFSELVRRAIPEPESSLGVGFLVGQRRSLPDELDSAMKLAGLTHIVVASGYNLTILVRLARRLFQKISKYLSTLVSVSLIVGFIAVTGLSPSMSRAGLVAGLSLAAWYYGRKIHPMVLLPFAVAITVLVNPSYAWGDIGWQLSFAAFAGVMILAPLLQAFYFGSKKPGTIRQILGETIAATLMTAPILISAFGYISNVALPANLLILPLVPLAMLLTFLAGIGTLAFATGAVVFGFPAYILLTYMTKTTEFFAGLSWAKTEIVVGPLQVAIMYAIIIIFTIFMWWRTRLDLRDSNLVE